MTNGYLLAGKQGSRPTLPRLATCPLCETDLSNCIQESELQYRQPTKYTEDASGKEIVIGGLTHIIGGRRCLMDMDKTVRRQVLTWKAKGIRMENIVRLVMNG